MFPNKFLFERLMSKIGCNALLVLCNPTDDLKSVQLFDSIFLLLGNYFIIVVVRYLIQKFDDDCMIN
jgi:hypothetical protein